MKRTTWFIVSLPVAAVLVTVLFVFAPTGAIAPQPDEAVSVTGSSPDFAPGEAALRATLDPETGKIGTSVIQPSVALDADTREALRRDSEGLTEIYHANGAVSVNLQGRFQNVSVVRIDENGKLVLCSEDAQQVEGMREGRSIDGPARGQTAEVR